MAVYSDRKSIPEFPPPNASSQTHVEAVTITGSERAGSAVGPMARADLRDGVAAQVRASIDSGATLLTGGEALDVPGNLHSPTVSSNVRTGMAAYHEESFGPEASIITVADADEAAHVANDTRFGLGASVWSCQ